MIDVIALPWPLWAYQFERWIARSEYLKLQKLLQLPDLSPCLLYRLLFSRILIWQISQVYGDTILHGAHHSIKNQLLRQYPFIIPFLTGRCSHRFFPWIPFGQDVLPAVVDFYADWCAPCKMVSPILADLSNEYAGKIKVYKVTRRKIRKLQKLWSFKYSDLAIHRSNW